MTINKISFALFSVLKPKSKFFTGGRITDIDLLTLDEAAKMATKHAGTEVTPDDFIRAAGRGEIELIALVRKETKFKYLDNPELEPWIKKGGGWKIPLHACKELAEKGFAQWRTQEDVEPNQGDYMQYRPTICITDDEPDLEAEPSDCRVWGHYVHALADAFAKEVAHALLHGTPSNPKERDKGEIMSKTKELLFEVARERLANHPGAFERFQHDAYGSMDMLYRAELGAAFDLDMYYSPDVPTQLKDARREAEVARMVSFVDRWVSHQPAKPVELPLMVKALPPASHRTSPAPNKGALSTPLLEHQHPQGSETAPTVGDSASRVPVVPFKKAALIDAHIHEWPTIERDIKDANTNGLAAAAKAGEREWREADALNWARAKGKLISTAKPADSLSQAMHNVSRNLPSRKHTIPR